MEPSDLGFRLVGISLELGQVLPELLDLGLASRHRLVGDVEGYHLRHWRS